MKKKNILLLTATIRPAPGQAQLVITDPNERLNEYRRALAFYAGELERKRIDRIIFAENSGFDLGDLKKEFPSPLIEWYSCFGLDYDPSYHRGYGEFKLLSAVSHHSDTLRSAEPTDAVWKVTGRYVLKNIGRVVRSSPAQFDLYIDTRTQWAEMSVMAWSVRGFHQYLENIWPSFATGEAPERLLYTALEALRHQADGIVTTHRWPTYLIGRRGTSGQSYEGRLGPLRHALNLVAVLFRRVRS